MQRPDDSRTLLIIPSPSGNWDVLSELLGTVFQTPAGAEFEVFIAYNEWEGFAGPINRGLTLALSREDIDSVLILNDDALIKTSGWLKACLESEGDLVGLNSMTPEFVPFWFTFIRRCVIDRVGLLDERFGGFGTFEDVDYCLRSEKAGFSTSRVDVDVEHHKSYSRRKNPARRRKDNIENGSKFIKKWAGDSWAEGWIDRRPKMKRTAMRGGL